MREKILTFIEKNSRIDLKDLAIMLGVEEVTVANELAAMEAEHIICGYHTLIDCKLCSTKNGFRFSRAEDNQRNAMALFEKRGWHSCWFALKLPDGQIRMLKHSWIPVYEKLGWKGISPTDMESLTMTFEQWLEEINNEDHNFKHDQDSES